MTDKPELAVKGQGTPLWSTGIQRVDRGDIVGAGGIKKGKTDRTWVFANVKIRENISSSDNNTNTTEMA